MIVPEIAKQLEAEPSEQISLGCGVPDLTAKRLLAARPSRPVANSPPPLLAQRATG